MKHKRIKVILLAAAVLLSFVGTFATYALLREESGSIINFFSAAHIFKVEYDLNGASGTAPATQRKLDATNPENSCVFIVQNIDDSVSYHGHIFQGWATSASAEQVDYQPGDEITLAPNAPPVKLYAVWTVRNIFTLHYDLNSPDGSSSPVWDISYAAPDSRLNHNFVALDNLGHEPAYAPENYTFIGWSIEKNAEKIDFFKNDAITVSYSEETKTAERTVYAVWEETLVEENDVTYTLKFVKNLPESLDGYDVIIPDTVTEQGGNDYVFEPFSVQISDDCIYDVGLEFAGWSTTDDGLVEYTPSDKIRLKFDPNNYVEGESKAVVVTLYAKWKYTYYVTFQNATASNSSESLSLSITSNSYEPQTIDSLFDRFAEAGGSNISGDYKLSGFSLNEGSDTLVTTATISLPGKKNALNLYAYWMTCDYAVYFHTNHGGTGGPGYVPIQSSEDSYVFHLTDALQSNIPVPHDGVDANFLGWATTPLVTSASDERILLPYDSNSATPHFTKTTIAGYLSSTTPTLDLYAVWEYHYSLTYDPGRGTFTSGENYTTSATSFDHKYTFEVDIDLSVYVPTRAGYRFSDYWSDQYERLSGERKYYHKNMGAGYRTTVELSADTTTTKTIYARYSLIGEVRLEYYEYVVNSDGTYEDTFLGARTIKQTSIWPARFPVDDSFEPAAREKYTFIGWSYSRDADFTWLNNKTGGQMIYGGRSTNTICPVDTDISSTGAIYAVWAPTHTLYLNANYNGGTGWYQISASQQVPNPDGCGKKTEYYWPDRTIYNIENRSRVFTIPFDKYATLSDDGQTYIFNTVFTGGFTSTADTITNAQSNDNQPYYMPEYPGMEFLGFCLSKDGEGIIYHPENSNMTITDGKVCNDDPPKNTTSYRSSGSFSIKTVYMDVETIDPKTPRGYNFTLYALWRAGSDFYKITVTDPVYGNAVLATVEKPVEAGKSTSYSVAANTLAPHQTKEGLICDYYAVMSNGNTVYYTTTDTWTRYEQNSNYKVGRRLGGQKWYIGQEIVMQANDPSTYTRATQDENGVWTYTLELNASWSVGQVFKIKIDYTGSGGTMFRLYDTTSSSRDWNEVLTDEISLTKRADQGSHTWTSGTAGKFWGNIYQKYKDSSLLMSRYSNPNYEFMGGYTDQKSGGYTYKYPVSETRVALEQNGTTRYQYYHHITSDVTVYASNDSPTNSNGAPVHTLTLYPVYRPWKTYRAVFDPNGGTTSSSNILESTKHKLTTSSYTFSASSSNDISAPDRPGYKLLGYTYDKRDYVTTSADPDIKVVEKSGGSSLYFSSAITVQDPDTVPDGVYRDVVEVTNKAPNYTELTLYAFWQQLQEYSITFDFNEGSYTPSSGDPLYECTSEELVELGKTHHEMTATPAYKPTNDNYTLIGYSYKPVTPGEGSLENTNFPLNADGSIGPVPIDQIVSENPEVTVTRSDGTTFTNLRLYAVWAVNYTNYHLQIITDDGVVDVPKTDDKLGDSYTYPAKSLNLTNTEHNVYKYGHRLAGLATEEGGDAVYTVTNGYVQEDLVISEENGATKEFNDDDNVYNYTLTLYPVWEKQDLFEVILMPNGGSIMNSTDGSFTTDQRKLTLSTSQASVGIDPVTISTAQFQTYASGSTLSNIYRRTDHTFVGYSLTSEWTEDMVFDDFTSTSVGDEAPYSQIFSNIVIDRGDPNIEKRQSERDKDITIYTVRIYLAWEPVRYFRVQLYPNGGTFHDSSGTPAEPLEFHTYTSGSRRYATESISITPSYTDLNAPELIYLGYKLIGYAYADTGTEDIGVTTDGNKVTLDTFTITRTAENTATEKNASGDEIEITTVKLYAVWGLQVDYISKSGTTNMPKDSRTVIYVPEALDVKTFDIPAIRPILGGYIFAGWGTSEYSTQEYGHYPDYTPFNDIDLKESYTFGADGNPESYGKLYAKWAQEFSLYYHPNGADNPDDVIAPDSVYMDDFKNKAVLAINDETLKKPLVRENYQFLGWSTEADATEPMYTLDPDDAYPHQFEVTGPADGSPYKLVLYAVWAPVTESASEAKQANALDKSVPPTEGSTETTTPTEGSTEITPPTEGSAETTPPTESSSTPAAANYVEATTPPAPVSTEPVPTSTDDETEPPETSPAPTTGAEDEPDTGGEET